MAQDFPRIGLIAFLDLTGLTPAARKYTSTMRNVDRVTKQTAQKVTEAGQQMASGVARSLEGLIQKSKLLADAFNQGALSGQSYADLSRFFNELGSSARVNVELFDKLISSGLRLGDAFAAASGQIGFSVEAFDRLIQSGVGVDDAFQQASSSAEEASGSITFLGRSFTTTALAVTALTAVLGASIRLVKRAISEYTELAEATRRLSSQTGLLAREASGWVQVAQASGVSAATASRGMAQFLSRISDLRREQQLGEESTSDFAQALDFLQVSITDGEGNLKSTEQLLGDVNRAFQELGPGARTTEAAMKLFGRTGTQLLPILTDQKTSLVEFTRELERLGAGMTALDQKSYAEFLKSQIKLQAALQGLFENIARQWIPILGGVADVVSELIGLYNLFIRELGGVEFSVQAVAKALHDYARFLSVLNDILSIVIKGTKTLYSVLNPLVGMYSKIAEKEEKLAQVRADAAQEAAEQIALEKKRQEALQDTLKQLDQLKSKLSQKLSDIDRDASQKWEDILVTRMRDAADRSLQNVFKLDDLRAALNEKLDAIERDFARRWDDILVKRQRDAIERGIRLSQRYEDLARATEQRRQDTIRTFSEREINQRRDVARRVQEIEEDSRDKQEKLERDHQRRLEDIRLSFLDTVEEAARKNDAVAVARALRQRARDVRDEGRRFTDEQRDLTENLAKKRQEIEDDRKEREADQRRELRRALDRIDENYQRQQRELVRQNRRARDARERQYAYEREDFEKARAEQEQAARDAYDKSREELDKANKRADILRRIQYERQELDFVRAWQRRNAEARRAYAQERNELAAHLNMTGDQLEQAYNVWMREAAIAAAQAARVIADRWISEIQRYRQYLSSPGGGGQPNLGIIGGRGISMAEGGVIQASSPTTVVMGDAGPETGVFLPGGSGSMNVNHNFGRLGVDFAGLPGGMNTQQVQQIVYGVMTQLAKGIQVPRS